MKVLNVETQSSVKRKLSVLVSKDAVDDALRHKVEEFRKVAKIPGFRKGRVPDSVIKNRFERDIKHEAEIELIDHTINDAIEQAHIKAVGSPIIEKVDYSPEGDFTYTVLIENIPEVDHIDFRGIEIKRLPVPPVTDEQIHEALVKIQRRLGVLMPLEEARPLRENDLASIKLIELDKHGSVVKVHDDLLWAVDEKLGKDVYGQIAGMLVGEKRKVTANEAKDVSYKVELKAIKYIKYPPIDDDLAKTSGTYNSLEELKSALKKDIEEEIGRINRLMYQDIIIAALLKRYPIDLPVSLVKNELEHIATEDEELKKAYARNEKSLVESRLKQLETYVRIGLVTRIFFDAIRTQENIAVSEEELKSAVEDMARQNTDTAEHVMEKLTKNNDVDTVKGHLLNDKILDLIIKNAKFIEEKGQ
ncbi:MAG: trigger factor [Deltaproteobacteria bacterium]|nr:trigger factor [Deltaproteobacteria bacterium]MCL5278182.1 trigger factor [Deltaproteobacteria bacterium]